MASCMTSMGYPPSGKVRSLTTVSPAGGAPSASSFISSYTSAPVSAARADSARVVENSLTMNNASEKAAGVLQYWREE